MTDPTPLQDTLPLVSDKNRKDEILAAYQELVKRYEQKATQSKGKEQDVKRVEEQTIVTRASGYTLEKIQQGCRNLEGVIRSHLGDVSEKLAAESGKLEDLQRAIGISENRLKEIHDIEIAATTLSELIESCTAKQQEMEDLKETRMQDIDREIQQKKLVWQREEEEHTYVTMQQVRREVQEHDDRKAAFERDLAERNTTSARDIAERKAVLEKEAEELKNVRERSKTFESELAAMKKQTQEETERRVRFEEKTRSDLHEQEVLRMQGIADLTITSLTESVKSMEKDIDILRKQLEQAHRENKEIALKVIEGAAGSVSLRNLQRVGAAERE